MIDDKTKQKFLNELEKIGNVLWACRRVNIQRSTYYRWRETDKALKTQANKALRHGRENTSDVGEIALIQKAKSGDMQAIKYLLSHNSSRYKQRRDTNATILYKKDYVALQTEEKTFEDWLAEDAETNIQLEEQYKKMGGIPPKADGTPIAPNELSKYRIYIDEWYKKKELDKKLGLTSGITDVHIEIVPGRKDHAEDNNNPATDKSSNSDNNDPEPSPPT